MKLVVRAADYGMTDSITDGCLKAIRDGILMDVGLMTNNYKNAKRAVEEVLKYPHVSIGEDINIVSGIPCTDPSLIPTLVNEDGRFLTSQERRKMGFPKINYEEVYLEMDNQVKRFIELVGRKPAYLAGHSYSDEITQKAFDEIKKKYSIPLHEDINKYVGSADQFGWYRISISKHSDARAGYTLDMQSSVDLENFIIEDMAGHLEREYSVMWTHCGYCDGEIMNMSTFSVVRGREVEGLCSPKVKQWIKDNNVELINYDQLIKETWAKDGN